jgi:hypothetical protein
LRKALKNSLGKSPTREQLDEALRIADRIAFTFHSNGVPEGLWNSWKAFNNTVSDCSGNAVPREESVKGFMCYEWAYGFERNIQDERPSTFKVTVEWARVETDPDPEFARVHYWVAIPGPNATVYVDDGYAVAGKFVHEKRPVPKGYTHQTQEYGKTPRQGCTGIPVKKRESPWSL